MTKHVSKIAVFTSGGDCSGLNAALNAVVRRAHEKHIEVYGILNGSEGLMYPNLQYTKLTIKDFQTHFSCLRTAGTILGTISRTKDDPLKKTEAFKQGVKELGISSIIVIGGDGSAMIMANYIKDTDINVITIPKTIDNDTPVTDYSIGFDTARNICMNALDTLQTTASSHHRVMVMEVMGRDAGHLALHSAIAGGANICLLPEINYKYENIVKKLREVKSHGITYSLIVVSEGCKTIEGNNVTKSTNGVNNYGGFANYLCSKLEKEEDGFIVRETILGHLQRGGAPTCFDRLIATQFGVYAVDILAEGKNNRMVILKDNKITDVDLFEAVGQGPRFVQKTDTLIQTAKALGMYIGEL